jgi:hypothetical protein
MWKESCRCCYWVLENDQTLLEKLFLLSRQEMSAVNYTTVAHVFSEAVQTLWPDGMKFDMLLLLKYTTTYVDDKSSRSTFIQLSQTAAYYMCSASFA